VTFGEGSYTKFSSDNKLYEFERNFSCAAAYVESIVCLTECIPAERNTLLLTLRGSSSELFKSQGRF
jgi:hypothetical protein